MKAVWLPGDPVVGGQLLLGNVVAVLVALAAARWWATRAIEDGPDQADDTVTDRLELLPEGHRPPPGLSPLSPSERFLAEEASRGLRDLQLFLLDAA
jgi:hypothetical protein